MNNNDNETHETSRKQMKTLLHPKNILKSLASQVPVASVGLEMLNQIEGERIEDRLIQLEKDAVSTSKLRSLELSSKKNPTATTDWSDAASEYLSRHVDLGIIYDASFHTPEETGRELLQIVAHGCMIGGDEFITCKEAIERASMIAEVKRGTVVIIHGMARYDFEIGSIDESSGLCLCRKTNLDIEWWEHYKMTWTKHGLANPKEPSSPPKVKATVMPYIGRDVGFLFSGEAEDIQTKDDLYSKLQFGSSNISHFRRVKRDCLKSFVTGVLPERIHHSGSAVFGRDGTLLGILSTTEKYPSDTGDRAVVRSLIGHPKFTTRAKSPNK